MNERIRELIDQCQKEVWGSNAYNGSPEFEGYELDAEKFAELIVNACATLGDYAENGGVLKPSVMIKEYFGVKE